MKKSTFLFRRLLRIASLIMLAVLFSISLKNCTQDPIQYSGFDNDNIPDVKEFFHSQVKSMSYNSTGLLSTRSDTVVSLNDEDEIDWTDYRSYYHEGINAELIEFKIKPNYYTKFTLPYDEVNNLSSINRSAILWKSIVFIRQNSSYIGYVVINTLNKYDNQYADTIQKYYNDIHTNFNGVILYSDWEGNLIDGFEILDGVWNGNSYKNLTTINPDSSSLKLRWRICWWEYTTYYVRISNVCSKEFFDKYKGVPGTEWCWEERLGWVFKCFEDPQFAGSNTWVLSTSGYPLTFNFPRPLDGADLNRNGGTNIYNTDFNDPVLRNGIFKKDILNCELDELNSSLASSMVNLGPSNWTSEFMKALNYYYSMKSKGIDISIEEAFRDRGNYDNLPENEKVSINFASYFNGNNYVSERDICEEIYDRMVESYKRCTQLYGHSNDEGHTNEDLCNCLSNSYSK